MKKNNKKSWILWLYIALLCCFIGAGVVYCVGMVEPEVGSYEYSDADDVIEIDNVTVPMGDTE